MAVFNFFLSFTTQKKLCKSFSIQVRNTVIGDTEIKNPMMYFSVPHWLRSNMALMKNLKENSEKLLTHYDTYATLIDIMGVSLIHAVNPAFYILTILYLFIHKWVFCGSEQVVSFYFSYEFLSAFVKKNINEFLIQSFKK